jgi:hypothetical protein
MLHGPWTDYQDLLDAAWTGNAPPSIHGRKPVAIERRKDAARFLYVRPGDGREPLPVRVTLPEYVYCA